MGHVIAGELSQERRATPRHNIYLPLRIQRAGEGGGIVEEAAFSVNVGRDGLYAFSRRDWRRGEEIIIAFHLSQHWSPEDGAPMVFIPATVVRFDPGAADGMNGVAATFREGFHLAVGRLEEQAALCVK